MAIVLHWEVEENEEITNLFLKELMKEFGLRKTYSLWKKVQEKPTFENLKRVLSNARKR